MSDGVATDGAQAKAPSGSGSSKQTIDCLKSATDQREICRGRCHGCRQCHHLLCGSKKTRAYKTKCLETTECIALKNELQLAAAAAAVREQQAQPTAATAEMAPPEEAQPPRTPPRPPVAPAPGSSLAPGAQVPLSPAAPSVPPAHVSPSSSSKRRVCGSPLPLAPAGTAVGAPGVKGQWWSKALSPQPSRVSARVAAATQVPRVPPKPPTPARPAATSRGEGGASAPPPADPPLEAPATLPPAPAPAPKKRVRRPRPLTPLQTLREATGAGATALEEALTLLQDGEEAVPQPPFQLLPPLAQKLLQAQARHEADRAEHLAAIHKYAERLLKKASMGSTNLPEALVGRVITESLLHSHRAAVAGAHGSCGRSGVLLSPPPPHATLGGGLPRHRGTGVEPAEEPNRRA